MSQGRMMIMIYGYARVSSKNQLKGNSLEEQTETLQANGCTEIVAEQYTGTTTDRPKFHELIAKLKEGDTLMVTKLDRFARNVTEGIKLVKELFKMRVKVHVLNVGLLEDTAMGNFFITTLLAVAELERNMIVERTQTGKAVARTKAGFKEGRPKIPETKMKYALELLKIHSYKEVTEATGISKATLARAKQLSSKY
jgi:DNA invertase Pin-like site-specific DNA recombinase